MSKLSVTLLCLAVTGCTGFGSNASRTAPVYDSVGAKTGQSSAPAVIASKTQTTTGSLTPSATSSSIAVTTATTSTAIEKKIPEGTVTSSVDPYSSATTSVTTTVTETGTTAINQANGQVGTQVNEQTANAQSQLGTAVAGIENDPRYKSGEEVLSASQNSTQITETGVKVEKTETSKTITKTSSEVEATANQAGIDTNVTPAQPSNNNSAASTDNGVEANPVTPEASNDPIAKVETPSTEPKRPENAAQSLIMDARDAVATGNYEKAASSLERAHNIEPKNAKILYDIAQIRYAQGKYVQSESFASKAAGLSAENSLSKKIWTLLANSRKALGNQTGAQLAQQKADSF